MDQNTKLCAYSKRPYSSSLSHLLSHFPGAIPCQIQIRTVISFMQWCGILGNLHKDLKPKPVGSRRLQSVNLHRGTVFLALRWPHTILVSFKTTVIIISFEMSSAYLQMFPLVSPIRMRKGWPGQSLRDVNSWDYPLRDKTLPAVDDHCQASLDLNISKFPPNTAKTQ